MNSKRKNRPSGGASNRYTNDNRQPKGRPQAQGVYNNTHFMHAATALVGNVVQVRLRSGNMYEGVFRTFSPKFDVALELPLCIKANKMDSDEGKVPNYIIFPYDTVVNIIAKDFDSQYATVGAFQTDAAISEKCNGSRFVEKELEPWDSSELNGDIDIELDGASNGWDANEMFLKNENQFGVQSTFDDSLSTYTVQIDKMDSEEFKAAEAKAEKLAAEIENNPVCRERLDLENGDEEAMYAAVERPENNTGIEFADREKELERERDRDRDREDRERKIQHQPQQQRPPMVERYITKPSRGNVHQSPIFNTSSGGSSVPNVRTTSRSHGEPNERSISTQMSPIVKSAGSSLSINMVHDNNSKYINSVVKRRQVTQSGKVTRNLSTTNNQSTGGGETDNGSIANTPQAGSNNSNSVRSNDGSKVNISGPQSSVDRGNIDVYTYGQLPYKYNPDTNGNLGKPRLRLNEESKKQGPMGRSMAQILRERDIENASNSSPLQTGSSGQHAQNSGGVSVPQNQVQSSQPQRQMRQRENQLQELRQFGQDFQLAGNNPTQPPQKQQQQQQHQTQTQPVVQQQIQVQQHQQQIHQQPQVQSHSQHQAHAQQQQQEQTQQLIPLNKVVAQGIQPPPAVSPPNHISTQQSQQNLAMQHVPHHVPQHHHLSPQQLAHTPTPSQHIYMSPQVIQQQQPPQGHQQLPPSQQMTQQHMAQSKAQQLVDSNVIHITKVVSGPPPSQQPPPPQSAPQQLIQDQLQPQQQPVYHAVPATTQSHQKQSPVVVIPTSDVENMQHPLPAQQPQQQQQMQQSQQIAKIDNIQSDSGTVTPTNCVVAAVTSVVNNDKTAPLTSTTAVCTTSTTTVKKPHVLNPSAKPFTPRSPSTPNPSRPHTPQTPVQIASIYAPGTHVPNNQTQFFVMQPQQHTAFQPPSHSQPGQQPRLRRSNYDNLALGPMGSQVHVSATTATGQPLLAAAPLQQFLHYQQSPHAPHFQSQPYASMVRMYDGPQPLQFIAQSPPSTTPSPGQPHQAYHQQPQPSPAGGGPQPGFAPQAQPYQLMCPVIHPSLVPNYYPPGPQHPQQNQQYQIVMPQHPAQ